MSGSGNNVSKQAETKAIPTRTIEVKDASQLPSDYSSTPGGTMFSTTPGGTMYLYGTEKRKMHSKIIFDFKSVNTSNTF